MVPDHPGDDLARPPAPEPSRFPWRTVGFVVAGFVAVSGLVLVAVGILVLVGLNQYGSNK